MRIKILGISLISAFFISLISLLCLKELAAIVVEDFRYGYLMNMAKNIEEISNPKGIRRFQINQLAATFDAKVDNRPLLWIVDEKGRTISSTTPKPLPTAWINLPQPLKSHRLMNTKENFYRPSTYVMRMSTTPPSFLVSYHEQSFFKGPYLWIQGLHTFLNATFAVLLALSIFFYYLRRKSKEARIVLSKIESGDLNARFEIKKFDQFGSLIKDFNRMADKIEALVKRLHKTENARIQLLQELGHDIRTPLTSLRGTLDTIRKYHDKMDEDERNDVFNMVEGDISYFTELLEKLTLIASIDEANYKKSTSRIDLASLINDEMKSRQLQPETKITWTLFDLDNHKKNINGDPHLLIRLIKNAFDNASRYAIRQIVVTLAAKKDAIEILIKDDGPGISDEDILTFGKRRERRSRINSQNHHMSLGLGSVIMRAIAEVHDAQISIFNNSYGGACLRIIFKA